MIRSINTKTYIQYICENKNKTKIRNKTNFCCFKWFFSSAAVRNRRFRQVSSLNRTTFIKLQLSTEKAYKKPCHSQLLSFEIAKHLSIIRVRYFRMWIYTYTVDTVIIDVVYIQYTCIYAIVYHCHVACSLWLVAYYVYE